MAENKRKKHKETEKLESKMTLRGKDKKLVKACFARAYELEREGSPTANGLKSSGRRPHWTKKTLMNELNSAYGEWIIERYREPLKRELSKIIEAGQSGMYLDQAKMVKKYGQKYSSVFDVSGSGSYVTYLLGITDTQYSNVKGS